MLKLASGVKRLKSHQPKKGPSGKDHIPRTAVESGRDTGSASPPESSGGVNIPHQKKMFDYHSAEAKRLSAQPEESADYTHIIKAHQTLAQHHATMLAENHQSESPRLKRR